MTIVAGIDVGLKNLAICVFDCSKQKILHWHNYSVAVPQATKRKPHGYQVCQNVINMLDDIYWENYDVDKVLIENQYRGNYNNIAQWIFCYFVVRGFPAAFVDAKTKFNHPLGKQLQSGFDMKQYADRKKLSVAATKSFLETHSEANLSFRCMFDKSSKKDDLGDSLMYCLAYAYRESPKNKI